MLLTTLHNGRGHKCVNVAAAFDRFTNFLITSSNYSWLPGNKQIFWPDQLGPNVLSYHFKW